MDKQEHSTNAVRNLSKKKSLSLYRTYQLCTCDRFFFLMQITTKEAEQKNMGRKKKNRVYVGIDGIDIKVNTTSILEENYYAFKNKNGEEIGTLKSVKDGYLLHLCLPKVLRNDNITPFTTTDFKHMESVLKYIQKQLKTIFGNEIYETVVRTCEVNATAELSDVTKTEPMLKLLAKILLTKGEKLFICATGEQTGKRYEAVKCLCSGQRIESIKTAQLSNSRVKLKLYNKSKEQNITDRGLLRIEFIYSSRGLKVAKTGRTLAEFLTPTSIHSLLEWYRKDYKDLLIARYWNNNDRYSLNDGYSVPIYKEMIEVIYNDLVAHEGQPLSVALINKNLIEIDYELFKRACKMYYPKLNSAQKAWARVQKSGEIQINMGVIDEFVSISRQIIYE